MAVGSQWEVFTTWVPQANRSQVAPYTIQGGANILVNQELAPTADITLSDDAGTTSFSFQQIGTATVNGSGEVVVTLSGAADDWVIVDAVALRAVPELSSAALL